MTKTSVAAVPTRAIHELWWLYMIEAVLAIFFGITAVFWPGLTLLTLVYLFGAFVLSIGIVQLLSGFMNIRRRSNWWASVLVGILGTGLGIYLVRHPGVSFHTFVILIGLILLVRGLLDLVRAFTEPKHTHSGTHRVLNIIVGILAILAGVLVMTQPAAGGVAFVWILGVYAIIFGVLNMAIAIESRSALLDSEAFNHAAGELGTPEEGEWNKTESTPSRKRAGTGRA